MNVAMRWGLLLPSLVAALGCQSILKPDLLPTELFCPEGPATVDGICVLETMHFGSDIARVGYPMEIVHLSEEAEIWCEWRRPDGILHARMDAERAPSEEHPDATFVGCRFPVAGHLPASMPGPWQLHIYYAGGPRSRGHHDGLAIVGPVVIHKRGDP